jgi:hypothetical protein
MWGELGSPHGPRERLCLTRGGAVSKDRAALEDGGDLGAELGFSSCFHRQTEASR